MDSKKIEQELINNKGFDTARIDVTLLTSITDTIIVCSATSTKHAQTLADKIIRLGKNNQEKGIHTEGYREGNWILVETSTAITHIFTEEKRKLYDIEKLWSITPSKDNPPSS
jgi:ribosome-associated protein